MKKITPKLAKELSEEQLRNDKQNSHTIRSLTDAVQQEFLEWWALFSQGFKEYAAADDSRRVEASIKKKLDAIARSVGAEPMQAKTNVETVDYASAVFANKSASKLSNLILDKLHDEAKKTAEVYGNGWSKHDDAWADKIINQSFDGTTWSNRIWSDAAGLRGELFKVMRKNLLTHTNPADFGRDIKKAFGVTRYQADRILRTEGARVSGMRQQKELKESGYEKAVWVASADACPHCRSLDGDVFKLSKLNDGEYTLPAHPNCRCSIAARFDRDDSESESIDPTLTDDLEKNGGNPFTAMEDGVGAKNAAQFTKFLASMNDPQLRKLYAKYGKDLEFNKLKNGRAYARGITVQLEQASFDGDSISTPMQTVFHELGHAIDAQSLYQREGNALAYTGNVFKKRMYGSTIQVEESYSHTSGDPAYKLGSTIREDLWQWATKGEYTSPDALGKKPRKKVEKEAWLVKERSMYSGLTELRERVHDAKPTAIANRRAYSDASDVIEATGYSGYTYPWGAGHGSSYWKTYGKQETEFFAEYTSARAASQESLKVMREMFPNACKVCDNMIDDMLKE